MKRIIGVVLCLAVFLSLFPLTVSASHTCPDCGELIDGDPYCSDCYRGLCCVPVCEKCGLCDECAGCDICDTCTSTLGEIICVDCAISEGYHCPDCETCYFEAYDWCDQCGRCYECAEKCETCSSAFSTSICVDCAISEGYHCPDCESCYFEAYDWCDQCGRCYECVEKCDTCSSTLGTSICVDCAVSEGYHCPDCEACYFEAYDWCDQCGRCYECVEKCDTCSSEYGTSICVECAIEEGFHCPECQGCYFENYEWCEICGRCSDCSEICSGCTDEYSTMICAECAVDAGYHCPGCDGCYSDCDGERCFECDLCANCADICTDCVGDGICIECAIAEGYHCAGCGACGESALICENCGQCCSECAEAFCESCCLCSECVTVCAGCGACSNCETVCENCYEYCSGCSEICSDCGCCEECCKGIAESEGCDCTDWVCVESGEWDEHYKEFHEGAEGSHNARARADWEWDPSNHWHKCLYCDEAGHFSGKGAHTYDKNGKCTVCGYYKDAKIQILEQPKDITNAYVSDANSDYKTNTVKFRVRAEGNSELSYKWYSSHYTSGGKLVAYPLADPGETEDFSGSDITVIVPTDACYVTAYYYCVITDKDGNTVTTRSAALLAKHSYSYYSGDQPNELVSSNEKGHILQCVGEGCTEVTAFRKHFDDDEDYFCDACGYEMDRTLKRIDLTFDDVYASFKVGEKQKDFASRINSSLRIESPAHTFLHFNSIANELCHWENGIWYGMNATGSGEKLIDSETEYALSIGIQGTLKDETVLPARKVAESLGFFYLNGKPLSPSDFILVRFIQDGTNVEITLRLKLTPRTDSAFSISVENGDAISLVQLNVSSAFAGQTVYLYTNEDYAPNEGEVFIRWECVEGNVTIAKPRQETASFMMPDHDVTIRAFFGDPGLLKVLAGDVDGDGSVTTTDARLTLQYAAGKIGGEALDLWAADVDGDGSVTTTDARLILQKAAGKIKNFPTA